MNTLRSDFASREKRSVADRTPDGTGVGHDMSESKPPVVSLRLPTSLADSRTGYSIRLRFAHGCTSLTPSTPQKMPSLTAMHLSRMAMATFIEAPSAFLVQHRSADR